MHFLHFWLTTGVLFTVCQTQAQDNRCYLPSGSASETFSVNEELPLGDAIGTLGVLGDASEDGDIELEVYDPTATIGMIPFSKTLTLQKPLDKEGEEGESGIKVEVICSRKDSDDPSIAIPVHVIIMDANDNTPVFVDAPYFVNISEATLVGSTVIHTIIAVDADQKGPFSTVEYAILPGPYSHMLKFPNKLNGVVVLAHPLDYEREKEFSVTIQAQDQGYSPRSSQTTLNITVLDADDQNPVFSAGRYKARLPSDPQPGSELLVLPTAIMAKDPDEGIRSAIEYSFVANNGEGAYFNIDNITGKITLKQKLPVNFKLPVTLVVRATQMDNSDRHTLTTVQITNGEETANELRFLLANYDGKVLEHSPRGMLVLTLLTTRPADVDSRFVIEESQDYFEISELGELRVLKPPDYEVRRFHSFHVKVSDGQQSDITLVNITVLDINDHSPRFTRDSYHFDVSSPHIRTGTVVGTVEVRDDDVENNVSLSVTGFFAGAFSVTSQGQLQITDVHLINSSSCYLLIVATDDGQPSRSSTVPVVVEFPAEFLIPSMLRKDSSFVLMVVFGFVIGILVIIIIILLIYIQKYRNNQEYIVSSHESAKPRTKGGFGTPLVKEGLNGTTTPMAETNTWGTTSSTQEEKRKELYTTPIYSKSNGVLKNSNAAMPTSHDVQWPNGSIPERVKKLGWDDESSNKTEVEMDLIEDALHLETIDDRRKDDT